MIKYSRKSYIKRRSRESEQLQSLKRNCREEAKKCKQFLKVKKSFLVKKKVKMSQNVFGNVAEEGLFNERAAPLVSF